jgi:hypothetical protein
MIGIVLEMFENNLGRRLGANPSSSFLGCWWWFLHVVEGKKKDEDEEGQGEAAMEIAWRWLTWLVKKTA